MSIDKEGQLRQNGINSKKVEQLRRRAERTLSKSRPKTLVKRNFSEVSLAEESVPQNSDKKIYLLCCLAILFALVMAAGPPRVLQDISQALYENNLKQLEKRIDYEVLRKNVADQLAAHVNGLPDEDTIDKLVEAENLRKIVTLSDEDEVIPPASFYLQHVKYSIESMNKVRATVISEDKPAAAFILRFSGFSWKLVNIIQADGITR